MTIRVEANKKSANLFDLGRSVRSAILYFVACLALCVNVPLSRCQNQQSAAQGTHATSTEELRKQTQNPVANLISVPFQNNADFNIGAFARDKNTLNIQPVYPKQVSEKWNLIVRIIAPVVFAPEIGQPHLGTFGLGDIQPRPRSLFGGLGLHYCCRLQPTITSAPENGLLAPR